MMIVFGCFAFLSLLLSALLAWKLRLMTRCLAEQKAAMEQYRQQQEYIRARQHDMNNRLLTLRALYNGHTVQRQDVLELFEDSQERAQEISQLLAFNNSTLAALYLNKYKRAKELGIDLRVQCRASVRAELLCCTMTDLLDVVGNLLDNAIEASGRGDRVDILFGEDKGCLVVSVANSGELSVPVDVVMRTGHSTKGEHRGYGLRNVNHIATKSGGRFEMTFDGDQITCTVYLPLSA